MGSWDYGIFENDAALDMLDEILDKTIDNLQAAIIDGKKGDANSCYKAAVKGIAIRAVVTSRDIDKMLALISVLTGLCRTETGSCPELKKKIKTIWNKIDSAIATQNYYAGWKISNRRKDAVESLRRKSANIK